MQLDMKARNLIVKALDDLALSLTNHSHKWTQQERLGYSHAIRTLESPHQKLSGER